MSELIISNPKIMMGKPVIKGTRITVKARLVQAWIEIHRDELMANWELAVNGQEIFKIDPLK